MHRWVRWADVEEHGFFTRLFDCLSICIIFVIKNDKCLMTNDKSMTNAQ